jgi:pimeloyl-ACP methyl ester carboxylesterase
MISDQRSMRNMTEKMQSQPEQRAPAAATPRRAFQASRVLALLACLVCCGPLSAQDVDPAVSALGAGFVSKTDVVDGALLHYVRGGSGPAVILLHGFPEDWFVFRKIMPMLAKRYTVVAVDLRGIGGSAPTASGYDAGTMALDIERLAAKLQLNRPYLVGHDIGGLVSYDAARCFPSAIRGVMLLDVPVPGTDTWAKVKASPLVWHFGFLQTPGLAEKLLPGREAAFFQYGFFDRSLLRKHTVTKADIERYATAYAAPDHLKAALDIYRAFDADEAFNLSRKERTEIPLALVGGDKGFGPLLGGLAQDLHALGWTTISTDIVPDSGHYVVDEQPGVVAELIEHYAATRRDNESKHPGR